MSFARRLVHDCVLEKATAGTEDRTGHRPDVFLAENEIAFKGNVQERVGREVEGPDLGGTVIADTLVFALPALSVTERDRIRHGTLRYEVLFVKRLVFGSRNDHLEILARGIRPAAEGGS